jgi:ribosomal silencing factor RsfS
MFYLRESEATATNVLSVRKQSVCDKCFICAKAKRQRQMFYLCESEATATNVLSARKRSVSDKASSRNGNQPHVMVMSLFLK